jgi:hypothetical protein
MPQAASCSGWGPGTGPPTPTRCRAAPPPTASSRCPSSRWRASLPLVCPNHVRLPERCPCPSCHFAMSAPLTWFRAVSVTLLRFHGPLRSPAAACQQTSRWLPMRRIADEGHRRALHGVHSHKPPAPFIFYLADAWKRRSECRALVWSHRCSTYHCSQPSMRAPNSTCLGRSAQSPANTCLRQCPSPCCPRMSTNAARSKLGRTD